MSFGINENIVRFDISVDVVDPVHVFNGQNELSNIKPCLLYRKDIFLNEQP